MFKELLQLVKWLFNSKPSDHDELQIVQMKHFPFSGYSAMSWCGRLITRKDPSKISDVIINHETIYLKQAQVKKTWVKYYLSYVWEWIKGNPIIHPASSAYYTIPYEMEAYANEENPLYVKSYEITNINRYIIKDRKQTYRNCGSISEWKKYIRTL